MNLPFGIFNTRSFYEKTNAEKTESMHKYEQKLEEYREALENYKRYFIEKSSKQEGMDNSFVDKQLSLVQTALDLTYLKEQGDKQLEAIEELKSGQFDKLSDQVKNLKFEQADEIIAKLEEVKAEQTNKVLVQLQELTETLIETNCKLEGFDKGIVNSLTDFVMQMQKQSTLQNKQLNMELAQKVDKLNKSVKTNRILFWLMIIFNFVCMAAVTFLILYELDMLPFYL